MGRFFNDLNLPSDIVYFMLKEVDQDQDKIIFTSNSVRLRLKKEGFIVTNIWASWRLNKSLTLVPNGWIAKKWTTSGRGLRVKFSRVNNDR